MRLPRIQFSLMGLLIAFAVFGVALAGVLKFGLSLALLTILWSLLLLVLMVTPVLALAGKPGWRPFHAGFSWFGWMYILVCAFGSLAQSPNAGMPTSVIAFPRMAIESWMFVVYEWMVPPESRLLKNDPQSDYKSLALDYDSRVLPPGFFGMGSGGGLGGSGGGFFPAGSGGPMTSTKMPAKPLRIFPWECCRDIGHAMLTILSALLGGCFVVWIARRNSSSPTRPEDCGP